MELTQALQKNNELEDKLQRQKEEIRNLKVALELYQHSVVSNNESSTVYEVTL
jgi:hypothetical protein